MASFTRLPCEIIISILSELNDVRFLLPSLLSCRHVYSCFKENPGVAAEILQRQIPPAIIPYSVAPPWEKEQLASVLEFLELKLAKASHDVLAHDVEFGELGIDYITTGDDNHFRQLWLSQGVGFVHRLTSKGSYDGRKALLKSAFGAGEVDLYDALMSPPETDLNNDAPLERYTDEDLAALFPPTESQDQDLDKGSFEAWRVIFNPFPRIAWVMLADNSGLRERAYVFWDSVRLEIYDLLQLFENTQEDSELQRAYDHIDEMYESFEERSKIWQKGGSGYWKKNDESRIVWPT
ncbi:hypothetical protein ABKA04_007468 [Annulohypoxylon sp. FPYF3050]